jgi:hypothetical protein
MKQVLNTNKVCVTKLQEYTQLVIKDQESESQQILAKVSGIMHVFKFIYDRETFEILYKQDMKNRLMLGKQIN